MATTFRPPTPAPVAVEPVAAIPIPTTMVLNGHAAPAPVGAEEASTISPTSHRFAVIGVLGLQLAIGFYFLWAFVDKVFGLGYHTPTARAWINGGSPTKGFLSGVDVGPLPGVFTALAGVPVVDWLFMLGLLGVGVALILGVALRPAAIAGATMLLLMYTAAWPFATMSGGQPTGSTNPIIDDHIIDTLALLTIAALASWSVGLLSRRWSALSFVQSHPWLR